MTTEAIEGRSSESEYTRTDCICDGPVLVDESVLQLGIRCVKCGLSHPDSDRILKRKKRNKKI